MKLKLSKDQEYLYRAIKKVPRGTIPWRGDADELMRLFIELGQAYLMMIHNLAAEPDTTLRDGLLPEVIELADWWGNVMERGREAEA